MRLSTLKIVHCVRLCVSDGSDEIFPDRSSTNDSTDSPICSKLELVSPLNTDIPINVHKL